MQLSMAASDSYHLAEQIFQYLITPEAHFTNMD